MGSYAIPGISSEQLQQNQAIGGAIGGIGSSIAAIGNAASGAIPNAVTGPSTTATVPRPTATPTLNQNGINTMQAAGVAGATPTTQVATTGTTSNATVPSVASPQIPTAATNTAPVNAGQNTDIYGATGGLINNLESEESQGSANSTAQAIINANAPNVAQGAATLNTGLAQAGISPSSSVSAIENANYQGQVQQQDTSEIAQVSLEEQQMQQQLAESLLPSAQKQTTDSSGWSIFGDVMSGIGDVATLGLGSGGL